MRNLALNGLLLIGSLLLCFTVLELGARLFVASSQHRWPVFEVQPDKKISFLPNRRALYETDELRFTVASNRYGRRDGEWTPATLGDPSNIVFIGDSYVFGYGVDHEWTLPTLLEARSAEAGAPREVFNFGLPGGGPRDYLALLEEAFELGIRADTVLLGIFVGNDFGHRALARVERPAHAGGSGRWSWRRLRFVDWFRFQVSQSPRFIGWWLTFGRWAGVRVYDTSGSYVFLREQTPEQEARFRTALNVVTEIRKRCHAEGCRILGIVIPNKIQVENGEDLNDWIYDGTKPNRLIVEHCARIGIECLDLLPILKEARQRADVTLYFPVDRHLTPAGNRVAADAIFRFLQRVTQQPGPRSSWRGSGTVRRGIG